MNNNAPSAKKALRKLLLLFLNFVILYGLLRVIITLGERLQMPVIYYIGSSVYMIALAVLVILFFYWNGGTFDTKLPLPEDLPEEWSLSEKRDYLEKRKAGIAKARSLLYILLPLLVTIGISYIELWFFV
ncbi:MAG: hypothetical protein IKY52_04935 [Clostridia bacterium]|nr:hypothetical protein [Clostridia bacterium]